MTGYKLNHSTTAAAPAPAQGAEAPGHLTAGAPGAGTAEARPVAGYQPVDLARDLGAEPAGRARAVSAYAAAFTDAFWQETVRAARRHIG